MEGRVRFWKSGSDKQYPGLPKGAPLRNLATLLVHLFGRDGNMNRVYLSAVHDRCLLCEEEISQSEAYLTYRVCPFCRFHYTLSARQRIELLADHRTFKESHKFLSSVAPLSFSSRGSYQKLLSQNQVRTGLTEAAVTGRWDRSFCFAARIY